MTGWTRIRSIASSESCTSCCAFSSILFRRAREMYRHHARSAFRSVFSCDAQKPAPGASAESACTSSWADSSLESRGYVQATRLTIMTICFLPRGVLPQARPRERLPERETAVGEGDSMGTKQGGSESPRLEPTVRLLNMSQAARFLGIDVSTVSRMVARGDLRTVDLGGQPRFNQEWLLEWVCTPQNEPPISELGLSAEEAERFTDYQERLRAAVRAGAQRLADIPPRERTKR